MKQIRIFFSVCLAALIILPLLTFNWQKDSVSEIDNRKLTAFDLHGEDRTNMLDSFIKDRIGFRKEGINIYTQLNDKLFGEMVHPNYTYGKNGYVFPNLGVEIIDNEFIDAFCSYIRQVQDYCESREVPFIYCLNPSKTTVYNRYLPQGYNYKNEFIKEFYYSLEKYGINYISNVELLTEKSLTEQVYNEKFDAGHWNDLGCYYGTNHLLEAVHEKFPAVRPHSRKDFSYQEKIETTLPVSHFPIHETVLYFENETEKNVINRAEDFSAIRLNSSHKGFGVFENKNIGSEELPRVLFFHGSYYNPRVRFYNTSFQETDVVHNYENFIDFDYYFNLFNPDCVILETAEYATTRNYFDINRLKTKKLNPLYSAVKDLV